MHSITCQHLEILDEIYEFKLKQNQLITPSLQQKTPLVINHARLFLTSTQSSNRLKIKYCIKEYSCIT
jgi:hypothetical protein